MKRNEQDIKDFVYYMIHSKSLSREQQIKRDKLFTRDSVLLGSGEGPNIERINYISPKNLHELLYRFNQDPILKYTCHEIDNIETVEEICRLCETETYSVRRHSEIISNAFRQLMQGLRRDGIYTDKKMYGLMAVYLTGSTNNGETRWSSLNIDTNWASEDLLSWGDSNPGIVPSPGRNIAKGQRNSGYELPNEILSNLSGNRILSFNELVIYFKCLFHIRRDNSLKDILTYINRIEQYVDENININFVENSFATNIELLTNVDKLIQAYKSIIRICKNCNKDEFVNIQLSFNENEGNVFFCIHHINTVYGKSLTAATQRIGADHSNLIKNQINGLCDLYIEADFGNQDYARISLWYEGSNPLGDTPHIDVENLENCQGVKYILKF